MERDAGIGLLHGSLKREQGLSLIELIIVMVAVGLIGSSVTLLYSNMQKNVRIGVAASEALSHLRYAQETAMTERRDVNFIVNPGNNAYSATYADGSGPLRSPLDRSTNLTVDFDIEERTAGTVSITAGITNITFNPDGIPYTGYPAGGDLTAPATIMTLNGSLSIILQPSGFSEIQ